MTGCKAASMTKHSKHRELSRQLRNEIAAGRYAAGVRLPSEPQLVKQFRVSRPTVSRALLDLQTEGLIERRPGSGTYVRASASTAAVTSVRQLGLLIPGLGNTDIFEHICGELASLARVQNYSLLWGGSTHPGQDTDASLEHAEELCRHFVEHKVSGVFFAPYELVPDKESANFRLVEMLRKAGTSVVLLDRDLQSFPNRSNFDLVSIDNVAGGYLLAEHLIKLGCRHIYFVARPHSAPTMDARITGVQRALVRHRLDTNTSWVHVGDPTDAKFVRSLTAAKQADAFICHNDYTAALLLRSLETAGLKVPRDVRVVGFDDAKYATLVSPPLTTVHQPCRDIAVIAMRTMLERIADPAIPERSLALTPRLVVRESCGAYLPRGNGRSLTH
jgi:DNA-binding LacI/PurR family transcriptional regulator